MPDLDDSDHNESTDDEMGIDRDMENVSDHSGIEEEIDDDSDISNHDCSEDENQSIDENENASEDDGSTNVAVKDFSKKKKQKKNAVIPPKRKIGPQKQKKEIHTYLKKAKKFEIRKLTRRITMLRNLKGTDEQKAKNNRKAEKLLLEIQAMKEFMIDQMTECVVDIFKGKAEQVYLQIWNAAQDHKEFEKMLQILSNGTDENKYKHIAFLRMVSSKDIMCKLKMIDSGTNIKKPKSKKALRKQLRKYNQKNKKLKKLEAIGAAPVKIKEKASATEVSTEEKTNNVAKRKSKQEINKLKTKKAKVIVDPFFLPPDMSASTDEDASSDKAFTVPAEGTQRVISKKKYKPKLKKVKKVVDPFFLPPDNTASTDEDTSSDEAFTAPAEESQHMIQKKKNRMGQRARRQLAEKQNVKSMTRKSNKKQGFSRHSSSQHKQINMKDNKVNKAVVDEKLHPSWQAKQKLKAQQGITAFSGTKITFDD